jgi:glycosyltransferase involved in cell wall biosynthesis
MSSTPDISLIVATYGRTTELELLLESLCAQTIDPFRFEVIIVDQNTDDCLAPIVARFSSRLTILHMYSKVKGLSLCRNIGLGRAVGTYCCVPDDDCTYYPDTLQSVLDELKRYQFPDMLIGKVYDRNRSAFVFKKTPDQPCNVSTGNFHSLVSSITLFFKNDGSRFDESFGVGAKFPSNEDADLILSFLEKKKSVCYSPVVACNHPPYDARSMSAEKLFLYGIGFGALCRKHFSASILFLYGKVIGFQVLMMLKALLSRNSLEFTRRRQALRGRIRGFFLYARR